jgi:hypothetical protein
MSLYSHLVFHHNVSNPEPVFIRDHSLFFAHGKNDSIFCAPIEDFEAKSMIIPLEEQKSNGRRCTVRQSFQRQKGKEACALVHVIERSNL